jgi:putative transposase
MRYPASEKLEIIRTIEGSHLPVKQTLDMLGIPRSTFYRWYDLYVDGGLDALSDRSPRPQSVWNRIPDARRDEMIDFALEHEALSTRELAVKYTDEKRYFISESSVYRFLKEADLITAPDYVVIKAADGFTDKTTAINEMWQTDFTYFKIIGWGWYYLSTILDDYSRYIIAWKLCTNMRAGDVTDTIELALTASGCDQAVVRHKPRLLSDNGSCYISGDLAEWLEKQSITHVRGAPLHPQTQGTQTMRCLVVALGLDLAQCLQDHRRGDLSYRLAPKIGIRQLEVIFGLRQRRRRLPLFALLREKRLTNLGKGLPFGL